MKSGQRAKQGKAALAKAGKSTLQIPAAGECNGTALRMATRRVSQLYDVLLAPCGLRSTQWSILAHLARVRRQSIGEIARSLVLDRSALAHNLKPLERDGLVQIVVDENDARTRLAFLTNAGHAKVAETIPLWERAQRSFEAVFGEKKAVSLRASLEILASAEFAQIFQRIEALRRKDKKSKP
jgi:DNA-binding MarR family transcriptional regulator